METKGIYTFPKDEKLRHRSLVEGLFRYGKSFYEFPFRVSWRVLSGQQLQNNFKNTVPERIARVQMMITVPKKKRRKAVDRVLIRRRIREAYRLNRHPLLQQIKDLAQIGTLSIAFVYMHDKNLPYSDIEKKMNIVIAKLGNRITQKEGK